MAKHKTKLPSCGLFLGAGVYNQQTGMLVCSGKAFTYWVPDNPSPYETIDMIVKENQGNTAQFWPGSGGASPKRAAYVYALEDIGIEIPEPDWENHKNLSIKEFKEFKTHASRRGAGLLKFAKEAKKKGIYTTFIYSDSEPEWSAQFNKLGEYYIGYDFGERFSFAFNETLIKDKDITKFTLKDLSDELMRIVKEHVDDRHAKGWGDVMATSSNFYIDYEIAAGADIPVPEDFAFRHLLMASAISRGLYRQYDLPMWGSHLAHEWYSWLPHANSLKFPLFRASLYIKYMSGAKMIINESGNWILQSSLCPDSPMHTTTRVDAGSIRNVSYELALQHRNEAIKTFCNIDHRSPVAQKYRKEISDFYDFVKANPAPAGQPEATVAIAKGNHDICGGEFSPSSAIGGAYSLAKRNPDWYEGAPERGWDIVKNTFYPRPPVLAPNKNHFLSGTPYGMADIASFANDQITADFLIKNYKALIFSGWNTCSKKQYDILKKYVKAGGKLCLSIPHLSTNATRNYNFYTVDELINKGDFSDLCGVKVKGPDRRFYWATGTDSKPNDIGLAIPRRYGIMGTEMGKIEITDPENTTVLAVDDEDLRPFILRRKLGKGEVFFINSWMYPGALNNDDGPGCVVDSKGLMGILFAYIAKISRGHVWITGADMENPDADCEYIAYSYFPDAGKICLFNIDFRNTRKFVLHHFGTMDSFELGPSEFKIIDSVKLKPSEKLNAE